MDGPVLLVGMMGSGKTSAGRALARRMGLRWIDMDRELARRHGPIPRQFARDGEGAFRRRESALLREILRGGPAVVSTGGGVVVEAGNRRLLRDAETVYLAASAGVLKRRLAEGRAGRPLLAGSGDLGARLRGLLRARARWYRDCACTVVLASRGEPDEVAERILRALRRRGLGGGAQRG